MTNKIKFLCSYLMILVCLMIFADMFFKAIELSDQREASSQQKMIDITKTR